VFTLPQLDAAELKLIMKIGPLPDVQEPAFTASERTGSGVPAGPAYTEVMLMVPA
jgi:hypothetical protein